MPESSSALLRWIEERHVYEFIIDGNVHQHITAEDGHTQVDVERLTSFAFHGREGHLSVMKEPRPRGTGYWYAYRSSHRRTVKRYLGLPNTLTIARLEDVAHTLIHRDHKQTAEQQEWKPFTSPVLLQSKLLPPRLPPLLVERPRLLQWLDVAVKHKMTLLRAPAGFGKTTLVMQWLHECRIQGKHRPVAWLSLESNDNDSFRFWYALIAACQMLHKEIGQASLALLSDALHPPFLSTSVQAALTFLLNDLTQQMPNGLLVLDDYHLIEEPTLLADWAFFLDHLPPTFSVLLLTRVEPLHVPLLRWRASGDISELHAADLRFTFEETAIFTRQTLADPLPASTLTQLDTLLHGWAAGLRLLLCTFSEKQRLQAIEQLLAPFSQGFDLSAPYEPLLDYLVMAILDAQPASRQRFLLQTSVLSRLNGSLCTAVTGEEDGAAHLHTIEQAGLFLEALEGEGEWYRFHALWSSAMRREASRRLGAEMLRTLSRRASEWYEQQEMLAEAVDAALLAEEYERAALLIESMDRVGQTTELSTMRRWLATMPEATLCTHPILCWLAALTLLAHREEAPLSVPEVTRVETLLQMAEEGLQHLDDPTFPGLILAARAMSVWRQEPSTKAMTYAQQALAVLPEPELKRGQHQCITTFRAICLFIVGSSFLYEGRFDEARSLLVQAYRGSLGGVDRHVTRGMLLLVGVCSAALEELHLAHEYYQQALSEARKHADRTIIVQALSGLASISYEWNLLTIAEQQIREELALASEKERDVQHHAALSLALLAFARGDFPSAQQQITTLLTRFELATPYEATMRLPDALLLSARLALETGDLQTARQMRDAAASVGAKDAHEAAIFQARLLLAENAAQEALLQLESLLPIVSQKRHAIEVRMLLSFAHVASKQEGEALHWLKQALMLAHHESFVRLFLNEGEPLVRLLRQLVPTIQEQEIRSFAQTILRSFRQTDRETTEIRGTRGSPSSTRVLVDPLTMQEQRVLRLLVAGETNQQIAQDLVVSVNTVKDHLKHLYHKLGVTNRIQASEVARQLHLLS